MTTEIITPHVQSLAKPEPRLEINIREAMSDDADFRFIDNLQKQHSHELGFMHRGAIEANIANGDLLIAETPPPCAPDGKPIPGVRGTPLGYVMGKDRYFKREDVGIVYQLVVQPSKQRSLIGAMLVQSLFERAAYGCKLFCCWCAQDLDANYFWESIGFVPLAFRTGSERKQRVHIFWQKRIREGDTETPYWFPSQTAGGALREGRLVIPIPPGTHWTDAKPLLLPGIDPFVEPEQKNLPGSSDTPQKKKRQTRKPRMTSDQKEASKKGGLWFAQPPDGSAEQEEPKRKAKPKKEKRTYHPKYVAAARELCARYLDELHAPGGENLLPSNEGKYDVSRALESKAKPQSEDIKFLDAA